MCKKLGITALVIAAGLLVLHRLDLLGYGRVALDKARQDLKDSMPPEVKIERLKAELNRLPEETAKYRSAIARETVEVNHLRKQVATAKANLKDQEETITFLRAELKNGDASFISLDGKKIPREQVESHLAGKIGTFQKAEEALKAQEEFLAAREEGLEVAKQKLAAVEAKKEELQARVAHLETELRKLRLAQTKNNHVVDGSELEGINKLFDEVEKQIAVEQEELAMQKGAFTEAAVEEALNRKAENAKRIKEWDQRVEGSKVAVDK